MRLKYRVLFRLFWLFTHKIPKKSLFPQITPIILGTFLTSNAQKVISPQISPTISSIYLTFLSDNLVCFYTQNSKKVTSPSSFANNIGNSFDIFGWQSSVFLSILTFLSDILVCFYTQNFKKVTFPSNYEYNIGYFFDPKRPKSDFPLKLTLQNWAIFWLFCLIIYWVFTHKIPKR